MSFSAKAGTLTCPASTGNASVSGLGFEPSIVLFFGTDQTAAGTNANAVYMLGVATSSSARHASSAWSDDAQSNSTTHCGTSASRCIRYLDTAAVVSPVADFVSMDTDGFTVNWTVVESGKIVHYLALGGDITAWCDQINSKTTTGNQAYTGVGFLPTALILVKPHGHGTTTTAGGGQTIAPSFGFASSSTARGCLALVDVDGQAASDTARYQRTDRCYAVLNSTSAALIEADFVSFDADGFTLNWLTASGTARTIIAIALGGIQAKAGAWNQRSGTGSQAVTGVGFLPSALLTAGWGLVADTAITADLDGYFGVATGAAAEGVIWGGVNDAADPTEADQAMSTTRCVQTRTPGTAALVAEAELTSLDADGFTLNYTTADTTARQNLYLALGAASGGSPGPWLEAGVAPAGLQSFLVEGLTNGVEYEVRTRSRDTTGNTSAGSAAVAGTPVAAAAVAPQVKRPQGGAARGGLLVGRRGRR